MTSKHRPENPTEADDAARQRGISRMKTIDALPQEIRAVVHEEGFGVVKAFLDCGITKARQISHLIETVRGGSKEIGKRTEPMQIAPGLNPNDYVTVPLEPTTAMVEAGLGVTAAWLDIKGSALTVNREKMRRRYRAMVLNASGRSIRT